MIGYYIVVSCILLFSLVIILTKYNVIFSNTAFSKLIKSTTFTLIVKRFFHYLVVLFFVITAVFCLIKMMPKDYFYLYCSSSDDIIRINELYDHNNFFKQLFEYYYRILPFPKKVCTSYYLDEGILVCNNYEYKIIDLGYSYTYMKNTRVWIIIKEKCYISFLVGLLAYFIQCIIGYPLGIYLARKENKLADKIANGTYVVINILPSILYFYISILLFVLVLKLPVSFEKDNYLTYIAPIATICFSSILAITHWVKKYISLEANKDYVKFALSKGLDEKYVFYKHILRNALIPFIRTIPTSLVFCLTGFYLLESSFNIPGIGLTLINAINLQDVYLVQGLLLFFSTLSVIAYLLGDLITILLDKKVDLNNKEGVKND